VPLICLKATEKSTNVRACQNISRPQKHIRPQRVNDFPKFAYINI